MTTRETTPPPLSLPEALALYQAEYLAARNLAQRTREEYSRDLADLVRYLSERVHLQAVDQVQRRHLEAYLAELDRRGLKGSSRARKVAAIRSLFAFCRQQEVVAANPAECLIPPEREHEQPRVLTEAEYKRLLEAVRHETRDAAIIELLLQTGMRLREVSRLTISDITLPPRVTRDEVGHVLIQGKGRRQRTVTLNYPACKALRSYLAIRPQGEDLRSGQSYGAFITPPPDAAEAGARVWAGCSAGARPAAAE